MRRPRKCVGRNGRDPNESRQRGSARGRCKKRRGAPGVRGLRAVRERKGGGRGRRGQWRRATTARGEVERRAIARGGRDEKWRADELDGAAGRERDGAGRRRERGRGRGESLAERGSGGGRCARGETGGAPRAALAERQPAWSRGERVCEGEAKIGRERAGERTKASAAAGESGGRRVGSPRRDAAWHRGGKRRRRRGEGQERVGKGGMEKRRVSAAQKRARGERVVVATGRRRADVDKKTATKGRRRRGGDEGAAMKGRR